MVWPSPPFRPCASLPRCSSSYRTFCQEAPGDEDPALAEVGERTPEVTHFSSPVMGTLGDRSVRGPVSPEVSGLQLTVHVDGAMN